MQFQHYPYLKIFCDDKRTLLFLSALILLSSAAFSQSASRERAIHVKFKERFVPKSAMARQSAQSGIPLIDEINKRHRAQSMRRIFPQAGVYEAAHRAHGLHLWYEIKFTDDGGRDKAIREYRDLSYFDKVEAGRDYTRNWENRGGPLELPDGSNDPQFANQWHLRNTGQKGGTPGADINVVEAWKIETGSPNVIVAVIDGGIDLSHPDLASALWVNKDEVPNNHIDDDNNGYVDDVHGYGFGDKSPKIFPDAHATHVAGIIGAVSNNGIGASGIAGGSGTGDGARLMSCATFGNFYNGGFEAAMVYAADNGATISQNSWGGGSTAIEAAIDYFVQRAGYDNTEANYRLNIQTGPMAGGIVIFAAGNSNTSSTVYGYPASYKNVIGVASTDFNDVKSNFSNFGSWVDISAPGSYIVSTYPGVSYQAFSGTSMACPQVSGVAALVISHLQRGGLKPSEIWNRIRLSARPIYAENPSLIGLLGSGRVDAYVALQVPDDVPPDAISDLHATETHYSSVQLSWTATGGSGLEGQAAEYEIRYSQDPISDGNFAASSLILNPPVPPAAGEPVAFQVKNLLPGTTYHFAIRTWDLFNNTSDLSNVLTITTPSPPVPELLTTALSEQLYTGGISVQDILVKNTGGDDLKIRLGVPNISPAPVKSPTGARARLFALNPIKNTIEEIHSTSGEVLNSIPMPEASTHAAEGLAFDGVNLFYGNGSRVYQLNAETGTILRSFNVSGISLIEGLGWSGRYLYVSDDGTDRICEVDVDTGSVVRSFYRSRTGLTFAGTVGTIFTTDVDGLDEIDVASGDLLREIPLPGGCTEVAYSEAEGLLFVTGKTGGISAIDPQTGALIHRLFYSSTTALASDGYKPSWLIGESPIVTIPSGTTGRLPVVFIATGLSAGDFSGAISVIPNGTSDPVLVPVHLSVTTSSDIETAREIDLHTQFVGFAIDTVIAIENRGFSDLRIRDIHSDDARVTTSLSSAALGPGEKIPLTVRIEAVEEGIIESRIIFLSDDPDEDTLTVPVRARVLIPPALEVTPDSLGVTLSTGEATTLNITVKNMGGSLLRWKSDLTGMSPDQFQSSVDTTLLSQRDSAFALAVGEFSLKTPSPEPITCLSYDPRSTLIYAKSVSGNTFYRYDPTTDTWVTVGFTPGSLSGQGAYLNGKMYYGGTELNIYDIETGSWSSIAFPVVAKTGNLTSDGQYVYQIFGLLFYRYDPSVGAWLELPSLPENLGTSGLGPYGGLSYHSGVIYAHEDGNNCYCEGGNTRLYKYYIASQTWLKTESISGKATLGSTIDRAARKYYVLGAPEARPGINIQMSIRDLTEAEWSKVALPIIVGDYGGVVFVGNPGLSGVYFSQGEAGTGFAKYKTAPAPDWIAMAPPDGELAPGETQMLTINVNATGMDAGTYHGSVRISSVHPALEKTVPLTTKILGAPDISIDGTFADLGEVHIGKAKGARIKFKNTGTDVLFVKNEADDPDFYTAYPNFELPTGESKIVTVTFQPSVVGEQKGVFTITSNDPDESSLQFTLKANAVYPPALEISPDSVHTDLLSGETSVQYVTITNNGGSTLDSYDIQIPHAVTWVDGRGMLDANLLPGQSLTLPLTFDASGQSSGTNVAKIGITSHGEPMAELPVSLKVASASDVLSTRKNIDYGDRYIHNRYDSIIQLKNNGDLPLTVSSVSCDNIAFNVSAPEAPFTLQPGQSINATIGFTASTVGSQSGQILISSDDPDESTYVISLAGNAVEPPVMVPDPGELTASTNTNEIQTQTLMLVNTGGSVLKWHSTETSNPEPMGDLSFAEQPLAAGDFTSLGPTPMYLIALAYDPASQNLYAQAPVEQTLYVYGHSNKVWSKASSINLPGIYRFQSGGATFLHGKMYAVYSTDSTHIAVYDPVLGDWKFIPNLLHAGTGTITTDGTLLYLAGGGVFKSLDPQSGLWTDLPLPMINLDGKGGMSCYNGVIYAHEGNGNGFAKYTIATGAWETLASLPDKAVLGSAIDPQRKRYFAYGSNGNNLVYEYDLARNSWSVFNLSLFDVSDGSIAYFPITDFEGVYFLQGTAGRGFARYEPKTSLDWFRIAPIHGEVSAMGTQSIAISYNANRLNTGAYTGNITMVSNDPVKPVVHIPVTLHVTNPGPTIVVAPGTVTATVSRSSAYNIGFRIENKGPGELAWHFSDELPPWLTASKPAGTLPGASSENIFVEVNGASLPTGPLEYMLDIISNDLFNPVVTTAMKLTLIDNTAPVLSSTIIDRVLPVSAGIQLLDHFADAENHPLSFTAISSNQEQVSVGILGSILNVVPVSPGQSIISVTATDSFQASTTTSFTATVDAVVGIEASENAAGMIAYPNAFEKNVIIRYHTRNPGKAVLVIHDVNGKIVLKTNEYRETYGRNETPIDGAFPAGLYNCTLLRNGSMISSVRILRK